MTTSFGGSDAEGAWIWRDAYDAIEAALVLQIAPPRRRRSAGWKTRRPRSRRCWPTSPTSSLTHTRRSEEQVALDQFSTPPAAGRPGGAGRPGPAGDQVLEPSAGTGLLAILAEACGASLSSTRSPPIGRRLLDGLFPAASRTPP